MNVLLRKNENTQNKATLQRMPVNSASLSTSLNNENILNERPLKLNSKNLAFHGLSSIKVNDAVAKYTAEFGAEAGKYFEEIIQTAHKSSVSGLKINEDNTVKFTQSSFGKVVLDTLTYPVLRMPLDIINACLNVMKKIPGLKNAKFLNKIMNKGPLKDRSDYLKELSDVSGIQNYFEMLSEGKAGFAEAHKRLKPGVSNYSAITDRTMTRIVSGIIPAFFLANDAYNLSVYMNNNKTDAKEQKRKRFYQELVRVGLTAWSTFVVMNMFTKKSNSSKMMSTTLTSLMVVASEMLGRYMAGNPVLPVSEEKAKKYAAKARAKGNNQDKVNIPDKSSKEAEFSGKKKDKKPTPPPKHGILTISNALNLIGGLIVLGFAADKITGIKSVANRLKQINDAYNNMLKKDFIISRKELNTITKKLRDSGFDKIADRYNEIVKDQKGDELNLGRVNNNAKYLLIHYGLVFPIRYVWETMMLPYEDFLKPTAQFLVKKFKKTSGKTPAIEKKPAKEKSDKEMLINSVEFLRKIMDKDNAEFKNKVNESLFSSLDNVYKSNYSNAALGSMFKIMHSAITSVFLIADNYNMVMIDSNGQDKELASQKAKERTVQRAARLMYGAFIIKLFNSAFAGPYNSSLLGAQIINASQAAITESLERVSVGLPLRESTKEEIEDKSRKNLEAKGIKGSYYRTMAVLTGKKQISEMNAH